MTTPEAEVIEATVEERLLAIESHIGMDITLRDYFAGQAGQEAMELLDRFYGEKWWKGVSISTALWVLAKKKLDVADAMLAERAKGRGESCES